MEPMFWIEGHTGKLKQEVVMRSMYASALAVGIATLLALAIPSSEAHAQKRGPKDGKGGMKMEHRGPDAGKGCPFFGDVEVMKKRLNLTDEQVEKIGAINLKYKKEHLKLKEQLDPKIAQLKQLLLEDTIDLNAVKAKLKEIGDLKVEVQFARIRHRVEIESVLTAEQKNKLRMEMHGKRHPHHGDRKMRGGPRPE